jgi:hypothetical protein
MPEVEGGRSHLLQEEVEHRMIVWKIMDGGANQKLRYQ